MMKSQRTRHGFTLIELLVVFTLLALLLTLAVPRYLETAEASRGKVREQNMATIRDALDKFKADQGRFPTRLEELVERRYLRHIPVDPVSESTDWTLVEDPSKAFPGVFDVRAPSDPAANAEEAPEPQAEPTLARDVGAMPIPHGGRPNVGEAMPMPVARTGALTP